jgi:hypothetical protein
MVDILSAKVPQIQAKGFWEAIQLHGRLPKLDAVSGRDARVEWQIAQTSAKLRLTDAAVAKEQDFDLRVNPLSGVKVLVVCSDFIQNVLTVSADFGGEILELAGI